MVVNPAGVVPVFDGGTPRILTAVTAVGVTGGQLVFFSGATGAVSSGLNSYAVTDIVVGGLASGLQFNGMVISPGNTASGGFVAVSTAGAYISTADVDVLSGQPVAVGTSPSTSSVGNLGSTVIPTAAGDPGMAGKKVGRALTGAVSGGYVIWQMTP